MCQNESELAYHRECWKAKIAKLNRHLDEILYEAHDAIADAKRGLNSQVSYACMERYGAFIKHHRGES